MYIDKNENIRERVKAAEQILKTYQTTPKYADWRNQSDDFKIEAARRALMKRINLLEKQMKAVREDFKEFNAI